MLNHYAPADWKSLGCFTRTNDAQTSAVDAKKNSTSIDGLCLMSPTAGVRNIQKYTQLYGVYVCNTCKITNITKYKKWICHTFIGPLGALTNRKISSFLPYHHSENHVLFHLAESFCSRIILNTRDTVKGLRKAKTNTEKHQQKYYSAQLKVLFVLLLQEHCSVYWIQYELLKYLL